MPSGERGKSVSNIDIALSGTTPTATNPRSTLTLSQPTRAQWRRQPESESLRVRVRLTLVGPAWVGFQGLPYLNTERWRDGKSQKVGLVIFRQTLMPRSGSRDCKKHFPAFQAVFFFKALDPEGGVRVSG